MVSHKSVMNKIDSDYPAPVAEHTGYALGNFKLTFFLRKLTPFSTRRARAQHGLALRGQGALNEHEVVG